ncbi:MAG: DUF560 domain-containing protein [Gammaproteobacteria bacterium]|nr:DUF560 domain-containing protein [Gammaproteobacteria bacterium]NNJ71820.1 DUF560 domain-containing protein [Enterobacterales bacterium]
MYKTVLKLTLQLLSIILFCMPLDATYGQAEYDVSASLELGSNSNVSVDEIDLVSPTGDTYSILGMSADMNLEIQEGSEVSARYSYSSKSYADFSQFDQDTHLFSLGYGQKWHNVDYDIAVRHANTQLDGQDFLSFTQISPSFATFLSKRHFIRGSYTNIDKTLNARPQRDATADQFSLNYYYFQNGLNSYWIAGIKTRQETAADPVFDYNGTTYRLSYKFRRELVSLPLKFTLDYRYRNRGYEELLNPEIDAFRSDKRHRLTFSAKADILTNLELVLEARYVDNQSNLLRLNYNEKILSLAMQYNFMD